jgi:hypothetical protein
LPPFESITLNPECSEEGGGERIGREEEGREE